MNKTELEPPFSNSLGGNEKQQHRYPSAVFDEDEGPYEDDDGDWIYPDDWTDQDIIEWDEDKKEQEYNSIYREL